MAGLQKAFFTVLMDTTKNNITAIAFDVCLSLYRFFKLNKLCKFINKTA